MYFPIAVRRCHWCNGPLSGKQERFCSKICKQAHYRARKKYVTDVSSRVKTISNIGNATKRPAKKKVLTKS